MRVKKRRGLKTSKCKFPNFKTSKCGNVQFLFSCVYYYSEEAAAGLFEPRSSTMSIVENADQGVAPDKGSVEPEEDRPNLEKMM
jgi:hypothetical protein